MKNKFIYIPPKTNVKLVDTSYPWLGKVWNTKQPERLSEKTLYINEEEIRLEEIHFTSE